MKRPTTKTINVLSVRQPFADEIIFGPKWCENRTWWTSYRGELFIHASRWDGQPERTCGYGVTGAIIGKVQLIDVITLSTIQGDEQKFLRSLARKHGLSARAENLAHVNGPICFFLADPQPLPRPIPTLGRLNIWKFQL